MGDGAGMRRLVKARNIVRDLGVEAQSISTHAGGIDRDIKRLDYEYGMPELIDSLEEELKKLREIEQTLFAIKLRLEP